jgi:DNA invertase Pin-like site-specific DNA recombinase
MIVGYVRTSLTSEKEQNQIQELLAKGVEKKHIFSDIGVSGSVSPFDRKGFKKMMDFIKENEVSHLYIYELSRLARDLTDTLNVLRDFDRLGICVVSISPNESWLQCDPSIRQLITSVMAWCAQRERENIIERTKVGMQRAKAEGVHCGRPFKDIDWKVVEALHKDGMNYKEIADKIDVPYSTFLRRKVQRG